MVVPADLHLMVPSAGLQLILLPAHPYLMLRGYLKLMVPLADLQLMVPLIDLQMMLLPADLQLTVSKKLIHS